MALGYILAALFCTGNNCELVQVDPGLSYATYEQCNAALDSSTAKVDEVVAQHRQSARRTEMLCVRESQVVKEVEDAYDVLETAVVHAGPSVNSAYVGAVESGQRTLVTGELTGTSWFRVLLGDGAAGYLYGDHLRKVGAVATPAPNAGPAREPPATAKLQSTPAARVKEAVQPPPPKAASQTEFQDCPTCPVMIPLAAGSFVMGSDTDPSERPPHRVTLAPFALSKAPVTVGDWAACTADGDCLYKPAQPDPAAARKPMTNLSWDDATQYARWLRKVTGKPYRLPSEAEWEYGARAGSATRYGWGEQLIPGRADCAGCGGQHDAHSPLEAMALPANAWGLYGMAGGAAEWMEDCWHPSYQGAPSDMSPWTAPNCSRHVLRGGSWMNPPSDITVSSRNFYDTSVRYLANGMRVAVDHR